MEIWERLVKCKKCHFLSSQSQCTYLSNASHGEATASSALNSVPCTLLQIRAKKCGREDKRDNFLTEIIFGKKSQHGGAMEE